MNEYKNVSEKVANFCEVGVNGDVIRIAVVWFVRFRSDNFEVNNVPPHKLGKKNHEYRGILALTQIHLIIINQNYSY